MISKLFIQGPLQQLSLSLTSSTRHLVLLLSKVLKLYFLFFFHQCERLVPRTLKCTDVSPSSAFITMLVTIILGVAYYDKA
ncbi:hypothetical protein L873DRAFT_1262074 [Choiromyces venosus 120613-1]|uniref:Uncharacterized protein n=1 Tax=Choiromyces venosus 120613-1 TaxID=1336337 RepID=A0A3N4JGH3_9PEZI|nr:hypothetical protein L873DRAFT_1262074 [Choiromyces venosus 120613-1]